MATLSEADVRRLSDELVAVEKNRRPVARLSERVPGLTQEQAYAIQLRTVQTRVEAGARIIGVKAAFTNRTIQQQYGMGEPAAGFLFDSRTFSDGAVVPFDEMTWGMVEPEIGCVLGEGLKGPGVTMTRALQALEGVVTAIEIVGLRFSGWKITASTTAPRRWCTIQAARTRPLSVKRQATTEARQQDSTLIRSLHCPNDGVHLRQCNISDNLATQQAP